MQVFIHLAGATPPSRLNPLGQVKQLVVSSDLQVKQVGGQGWHV